MRRSQKELVESRREVDLEADRGEEILLEIAEDARRLKNRYPAETVVPEGGE